MAETPNFQENLVFGLDKKKKEKEENEEEGRKEGRKKRVFVLVRVL